MTELLVAAFVVSVFLSNLYMVVLEFLLLINHYVEVPEALLRRARSGRPMAVSLVGSAVFVFATMAIGAMTSPWGAVGMSAAVGQITLGLGRWTLRYRRETPTTGAGRHGGDDSDGNVVRLRHPDQDCPEPPADPTGGSAA